MQENKRSETVVDKVKSFSFEVNIKYTVAIVLENGTRKIAVWKTAPRKIAPYPNSNPNTNPNPGGNLLGVNLPRVILRGAINFPVTLEN